MPVKKFKLLSSHEAAKMLDVHRSRVRQLCRSGKLKGNKVGRDWIINVDEIKKYILQYNLNRR
jgi:excisionase family DNA binding protein